MTRREREHWWGKPQRIHLLRMPLLRLRGRDTQQKTNNGGNAMRETEAVANLILAETRQRGEVLRPVKWRIR